MTGWQDMTLRLRRLQITLIIWKKLLLTNVLSYCNLYPKSILFAHDAIAQKDFYPHLPDIPVEVDEDEETIKIVQLVKSNEPLVSFPITVYIVYLLLQIM